MNTSSETNSEKCAIFIWKWYYRFLTFPAACYGQTQAADLIKATPRKDRAARFAAHTPASFSSFLPKTPWNTPVFLCRFGQYDEKADCASARQYLCGVALKIDIKAIPLYFRRYRLIGYYPLYISDFHSLTIYPAFFIWRRNLSEISAINSELVGFPLLFLIVYPK